MSFDMVLDIIFKLKHDIWNSTNERANKCIKNRLLIRAHHHFWNRRIIVFNAMLLFPNLFWALNFYVFGYITNYNTLLKQFSFSMHLYEFRVVLECSKSIEEKNLLIVPKELFDAVMKNSCLTKVTFCIAKIYDAIL